MAKRIKSEKQKERDKKGAERMKRFEENQTVEELPKISDDEEWGVMVAYQKKEPGEWERIEIPYKKKKKGSG
jgi:hypothetical protein